MLKLKDLATIFVLSAVGLCFALISLLVKFFVEYGVIYGIIGIILVLWMIKFITGTFF